MNTSKLTYNSPFYRVFKALNLKINVSGPLAYAKLIFPDGPITWKYALTEETAQFSTSGHRNARMSAADHEFLSPFKVRVGGNVMVPIMSFSIMATIMVASDPDLREQFNNRSFNATVPQFVNVIFNSLRGTERRGISAQLFYANDPDLLKHFNITGTIFDLDAVKDDNDMRDFLFSMIYGNLLPSYDLPMETFKIVSFNTEHFTVASIVFKYVNDTFQMFINPISTIKSINFMFDPTILEASIAFFCGVQAKSSESKLLDQGSFYTFFEMQINKQNFFPTMLSFFCERRTGYCNPNTVSNREKKSLRQNQNDTTTDIAMTTMSGTKNNNFNKAQDHIEMKLSYEYCKLLNNLYETSRPTFFKILRQGKLLSNLSKVFSTIQHNKTVNVSKPTGLL